MEGPRRLVSAAVAGLLLASCTGDGEDRRPPTPNVLLIITDDQRLAGTMEVMPKTVEGLGDGGVTFSNAFVTTPVCCPSRASILTGRYVHNHGVRTNSDADELDDDRLLQGYLQEAGYRTALVGKYLVRPGPYTDPEAVGIDPPGFDDWHAFLGGYRNALFNDNGELVTVEEYATRHIADVSLDLLREFEDDDDRPWFLYVAPFAPHYPWIPATRYKDAPLPEWDPPPSTRSPVVEDKPAWVSEAAIPRSRSEKARNHQLRTLMSVDDLVARLLGSLEDLNEEADTLVFYLSDNGYHWGEHGLGEKSSPYAESVRVPLLARWPGHFEAGSVDDRLVANIDLAPTILDAAGVRGGGAMDGLSLLTEDRRSDLLLEHWREPELNEKVPAWRSVTTTSLQYIATNRKRGRFEELYDLESDPFQMDNIADQRPAALKRLRARLAALAYCSGGGCR